MRRKEEKSTLPLRISAYFTIALALTFLVILLPKNMADPLFFTVIGIVGTAAFIAKAGRKGSEPNAKWIKFFEHFAYMGLIWIGFLLIATRIEF